MTRDDSEAGSLEELLWAQTTLIRVIGIVQNHSHQGLALTEAIHALTKGSLWLETIVQEQTHLARRRAADAIKLEELRGTEPEREH